MGARIDFAVLKINGKQVQKLSKDEAVQAFLSPHPFQIEIQQCQAFSKSFPSYAEENFNAMILSFQCSKVHTKTQECQTDFADEIICCNQSNELNQATNFDDFSALKADKERLIEEEHDLFDQCLAPEIDIEEVTLRKSSSNEELGLSIVYSGAPDGSSSKANSGGSNNDATTNSTIGSGSEYNNENCTEVFISHIQADSVAWRDGRLRQGDQILQINGKEIKTKEETETLIAENNNAVTLLVSRYLYTDEDDFNDPSLVVDLEEVEEDEEEEEDNDESYNEEEKVERSDIYSNLAYENCTIAKQEVNLIKDLGKNLVASEKSHSLINAAVSAEILEDAVVDEKENSKNLPHEKQRKSGNIVSTLESDTEHIYETIPEDSETEPFYCSPYESSTYVNAVGTCSSSTSVNGNGEALQLQQRQKQRVAQWLGLVHSSSASAAAPQSLVHQHELEDNNSSSAYNTGGSNTSAQQQKQMRVEASIGVSRNPQDENVPTSVSYKHFQKLKEKINQKTAGFSGTVSVLGKTSSVTRPGCDDFPVPDTLVRMYPPLAQLPTNQQALIKKNVNRNTAPRSSHNSTVDHIPRTISMLCPQFNVPNLRQYHFVSSQEVSSSHANAPLHDVAKVQHEKGEIDQPQKPAMVWKVKRRPDGTRYIVRRPATNSAPSNDPSAIVGRHRILRNVEYLHNDFTTTEDDTISEIKTGRYWSKEERKKHVEKAREKRQQQQQQYQQQQQQLIEAATTIRISDKMVARLQQYRKQRQKQQHTAMKVQHQDLQFGGSAKNIQNNASELQSSATVIASKTLPQNSMSKMNSLSSQFNQQQHQFISHSQKPIDGLNTAPLLLPIENINPNENCSSP